MKVTIVAGARPNFMKIAPIIHQILKEQSRGNNIHYRLVHTGQHYDKKLSQTFFDELKIPNPHINLEIGSGSQAEQTAGIMIAFEKELLTNPTDFVLVVGDVTSTMACSIVAKKLHTKVVHVEGGIRSFDISMPEEINRMVTDSITDYFYVTSDIAIKNLKDLGIKDNAIIMVGNTMIDTLIAKNVDEETKLEAFLTEIINSSNNLPIIFPVHPRTKNIISKLNLNFKNLHFIEPLGYLEFNYLVKNSFCVITDSGGITEETTFMKIPCLTLRDNTERPETITIGTNELVGTNPKNINKSLLKIFKGEWKKGHIPKFWDGKASERIVDHLLTLDI